MEYTTNDWKRRTAAFSYICADGAVKANIINLHLKGASLKWLIELRKCCMRIFSI